jgi:methoxymalonate biosynthesis acyl carrier protein
VTDDDCQRTILEFIHNRFPGVQLRPDDDIFALGFVNSLFAMELVMFLESRFGFTISGPELRLSNLRSLEAMSALVDRHAHGVEPVGERQ